MSSPYFPMSLGLWGINRQISLDRDSRTATPADFLLLNKLASELGKTYLWTNDGEIGKCTAEKCDETGHRSAWRGKCKEEENKLNFLIKQQEHSLRI